VLILLRLSLAYPLLASAVFHSAPFTNPLNTTVPVVVVLVLGVLLAAGVYPQWLMGLLSLWMGYVVAASMLTQGAYVGLDAAKRELGLLAVAVVYALLGPDRWTWPKTPSATAPVTSQTDVSTEEDRIQPLRQQGETSVTTPGAPRSSS
jgi:hypothetical protein